MQIEEQNPARNLTELGYLPQKDAAEFIGKSENTLWRWRRKKGLRYYRIGGTISYKKSDLIDFIEACKK